MWTQASNGLTGGPGGLGGASCGADHNFCGREKPITKAVPAETPVTTNSLLLTGMAEISCGAVNRAPNALVSSATANVAAHGIIDVGI